jgi:hypothetical protein
MNTHVRGGDQNRPLRLNCGEKMKIFSLSLQSPEKGIKQDE